MGKNTQIAELINYISVNGSGDIVMTGNIIMPGGAQAATQSYVNTAISNLVNAAPTALDTLKELATALNNDASFATTVTNSIASKLALSGGTLTGQLNGTNARFFGSQAYYAEVSADSAGGFIQAYNASTLKYQPYLIYGGGNTSTFSLLTLNNAGATFSGTVVSAGLITGQNGIYQSNASSVIASNRYDTYNGGSTQMQFNFPAAGSVAFNNGSDVLVMSSNGSSAFSGFLTAKQNFKVLGNTYTSIELSDGGTGDPGYIYVYYNGTRYFSIGANDTYFNYGNVGIGTAAPGYRLHVQDSTNIGTIALGHDAYPGLIYSSAVSGEFRIDNRSSSSSGYITFYPNGQASTLGNEAMRINTSRHILIGQTTANGSANGIYFRPGIESGFIVTSDVALQLSRLGTTGIIQTFYSGTTRVGQISVTASSISLESNGSGGIIVTSGGNVLVGTTSNLGSELNVNNTIRVGVAFGSQANITFGDAGTPYWTVGRPASTGNFSISSYATTAITILPTSGNTGIGNTNPSYKLDVSGSVRSSRVIYNWYNGAWQGNGTYWHMKTNLYGGAAGNSQYTMSYFKGYSYSYSAHILEGGIGFHNWSGALYSLRSTGNLFTTAYVASDGYVVLVIPSGSGESGVTLDWHQHWDYPFIPAVVTAAKLYSATTGGY